jgi:hypothetical protein
VSLLVGNNRGQERLRIGGNVFLDITEEEIVDLSEGHRVVL